MEKPVRAEEEAELLRESLLTFQFLQDVHGVPHLQPQLLLTSGVIVVDGWRNKSTDVTWASLLHSSGQRGAEPSRPGVQRRGGPTFQAETDGSLLPPSLHSRATK